MAKSSTPEAKNLAVGPNKPQNQCPFQALIKSYNNNTLLNPIKLHHYPQSNPMKLQKILIIRLNSLKRKKKQPGKKSNRVNHKAI